MNLDILGELEKGGEWLVAARRWMQQRVKNGDSMNWSSHETISIPFNYLQDLALKVAVAAVDEDRKKLTGGMRNASEVREMLHEAKEKYADISTKLSIALKENDYREQGSLSLELNQYETEIKCFKAVLRSDELVKDDK